MNEYVRNLDRLLEEDGSFATCYTKLTSYAYWSLETAKTVNPLNPALRTLEPLDLVDESFNRLLDEGVGDKRPYYALRNFVNNRLRALSRSPQVKREIPVGEGEEEWSEFWQNVPSPDALNPAQSAETKEEGDNRKRRLFGLRGDFSQDCDVLQILDGLECEYFSRKEIVENSELSEARYDSAFKRIRRKILKYKKETQNEWR